MLPTDEYDNRTIRAKILIIEVKDRKLNNLLVQAKLAVKQFYSLGFTALCTYLVLPGSIKEGVTSGLRNKKGWFTHLLNVIPFLSSPR